MISAKDLANQVPLGAVQEKIIRLLREQPNFKALHESDIRSYLSPGVDAQQLFSKLQHHERVQVHQTTSGELKYSYLPHVVASSSNDVIDFLQKNRTGVSEELLKDAYSGALEDCEMLCRNGRIIGLKHYDKHMMTYFPRTSRYMVRMPGKVTVIPNKKIIETSENIVNFIRPGDLISFSELQKTVRLSTAGGAKQYSCSSIKDHSTSLKYMFRNDSKIVHIDTAMPVQENVVTPVDKYGCSNDIRSIWMNTSLQQVAPDRLTVQKQLVQEKLIKGVEINKSESRKRKKKMNRNNNTKRRKNRTIKVSNQQINAELLKYLKEGKQH